MAIKPVRAQRWHYNKATHRAQLRAGRLSLAATPWPPPPASRRAKATSYASCPGKSLAASVQSGPVQWPNIALSFEVIAFPPF